MFTKEQWDTATSIYNQLGKGERIVIRPWYGRAGVNKAKACGAVFTLRVQGMRYHLGNPFTYAGSGVRGLIVLPSVKDAVIAYIAWVLFSYEERAIQIREWLAQGVMKNKPLIYYKNIGEPSHAHALEWLIDNWQA